MYLRGKWELGNIGEIKIVMEDDLLKKFKEEAMKRFGYAKGSFSIAARDAIIRWLESPEEKKEFKEALKDVAGIWTGKEMGYMYVRKIRKDSEKRLRRLNL
ncbi:MAG: hypothetical protein ACUVTD_01820 [Nitrososphaerales archaeon]